MPSAPSDHAGRPSRVSPRLVIGVVLAALALIFIAQNTGRGRVTFLAWHVDAPNWIWLVIIFAIGAIVGSLLPWIRRR